MKIGAALRAVAATAVAVSVAGCGNGGSEVSNGRAASPVVRPTASATSGSDLMAKCWGERYAHRQLPSKYARVLRKADWQYFTAWAQVGPVAVVNVVYAETADSHERAVVFIRGDKIIGADAASPEEARFDARICSVGDGSAVTGYWYRMNATGPDRTCPTPRPAFATVRWRVTAKQVVPLDHIPRQCK